MKLMKNNLLIIILLLGIALCQSCKTASITCFDEKLFNKHKNDACPEHCPGVKGCDGKTYCNECIANSKGIKAMDLK